MPCRVLGMPVQPAFPLRPPPSLPAVDPSLASLTSQELGFFDSQEQEASSQQLKFKVGVGVG